MAHPNVIINGVQYNSVPEVKIPLVGGGTASFLDTDDATLSSGNQMLAGVTAYSGGSLITGSIASKSSSDLTVSGATVTAPAGYYASSASKAVASGSATTPATSITANPSISVNSTTGLITATVSASQSVTPTVSAGYVSSGTSGTVSVSGSDTEQLSVKAAATYNPSTSAQTVSAGQFLTGAQTFAAVTTSNLLAQYIANGITVKVGCAADDDSVASVTGSLSTPVISQDSTTKVLSIS